MVVGWGGVGWGGGGGVREKLGIKLKLSFSWGLGLAELGNCQKLVRDILTKLSGKNSAVNTSLHMGHSFITDLQ